MNTNILTFCCLLIFSLAVTACTTQAEIRTKTANEESSKADTEKEQEANPEWINETRGYFTDPRDNRKYSIVKIGTQTWFAENLAYAPDSGDFWAFDDNRENAERFGYLYFWETAITACPDGWHIPDNEEWYSLINYLGGKTIAGNSLKAKTDWNNPNEGVSNSSGFTALPGGNRAVSGLFYHLGDDALFWSGTPKGDRSAYKIRLSHDWDSVGIEACYRRTGMSVRCIKD